jgi:NhaA family Na+:H+ antiporter
LSKNRFAPFRDFLERESSSGILLLAGAALGLLIANSPLAEQYFKFLNLSLSISVISIELTLIKFINYGLMTIFFFVVGLEIKRELTSGHLASIRSAAAPFIAAIGGMALPALIYLAIAGGSAVQGWAIPVATDIALAVGILVLMGERATDGIKTFLLALAVIDDIGAILIIAIFFSTGAIISWLVAALGAVLAVFALQKLGVLQSYVYFIVGILLWISLYKAGIHPTLAGVIMGLLTPAVAVSNKKHTHLVDVEDGTLTIVEKLEGDFHRFSAFIVVPIFALANSGIELSSAALKAAIASPIAWGIFAGLVLGKPLGIFLISKASVAAKLVELPAGTKNQTLIAVGSTAGIGFTVAIFIAKLAFTAPELQDLAITAVIAGSLVSGLIGVALFRLIRH